LHWLGFRVSGEGASGLFEVQVNDVTFEPVAWVRRVSLADKIVAVDEQGNYPNQIIPLVDKVDIPFAIWNTLLLQPLVGGVNLIKNSNFPEPPTVDIIIDDASEPAWKSQYTLTVLWANSTIYVPPGGGGGTNQGLTKNNGNTFITAESPFSDHLELKINASDFFVNNIIPFFIFDGTGQLVFTGSLSTEDGNHRIETQGWSNGIYFLICNNGQERTVLKMIKAGF
jgi:hypothetical protein